MWLSHPCLVTRIEMARARRTDWIRSENFIEAEQVAA